MAAYQRGTPSVTCASGDAVKPTSNCCAADRDLPSHQAGSAASVIATVPTAASAHAVPTAPLCGPLFLPRHMWGEWFRLHPQQRQAVFGVLSAQDYALLLGMPGTGKTTCLAFAARAAVALGRKVLLVAYTHSATDTLLEKVRVGMLREAAVADAASGAVGTTTEPAATSSSGVELPLLRLGRESRVALSCRGLTTDAWLRSRTSGGTTSQSKSNGCALKSFERFVLSKKLVATTALGCSTPLLSVWGGFDLVIIDEASQMTEPTVLAALRLGRVFALLGDPEQLQPLVLSRAASAKVLRISLMERLAAAHPWCVQKLCHQFRMNGDVQMLANEICYQGQLKAGSPAITTQQLSLDRLDSLPSNQPGDVSRDWLREVLAHESGFLLLDSDGMSPVPQEQHVHDGIVNEVEATAVAVLVGGLLRGGLSQKDCLVLSPYKAQLRIIGRQLASFAPHVEVCSIDRSQGRDASVVILSLVRSNVMGQLGELVQDGRRVNVAVTRARAKLFVFASVSTFSSDLPAKEALAVSRLVALATEKQWSVSLPHSAHTMFPSLLVSE